eukprot:206743_1
MDPNQPHYYMQFGNATSILSYQGTHYHTTIYSMTRLQHSLHSFHTSMINDAADSFNHIRFIDIQRLHLLVLLNGFYIFLFLVQCFFVFQRFCFLFVLFFFCHFWLLFRC